MRRALAVLAAVAVAAVATVATVHAHHHPAPTPGTSAYYQAGLAPMQCGRFYSGPLRDVAWARGAARSGVEVCGHAGPGLEWARFAHVVAQVPTPTDGSTLCVARRDVVGVDRYDPELLPILRSICRAERGTVRSG